MATKKGKKKTTSNKRTYVIKYDSMTKPPEVMAVGTVVPKMSRNAMDYLSNVRDFNRKMHQGVKEQIKLSRKLYMFDGILSTAIDILTEFPTTEFYIENVKDEKCKRLLNWWIEEVNRDNPNTLKGLQRVSRQIAHSFFVDGNAFPYETWSLITDEHNKKIKRKKLPMKITLLNPLSIDIPKDFVEFGFKIIKMKVSDDLIDIIRKQDKDRKPEEKELLKFVPKKILELSADRRRSWDGWIQLDTNYITHLKRKSQDYDVWGVPYLTRVFHVAASKERLRALDDSTTEGMVNFLTIFKIGDPKNSKTWSQPRLQAFAGMLRNPAASNTLVWAYDIDVITVGPKGDVLNFKDKYAQVNYDMLAALGIPEILFTGQGSQAGVWTAVLSMLERLEKFREDMKVYFEGIMRKICIENGFSNEYPKIRWARMRLRDERAAKNIVMALSDRGLLPFRTVLNELNYDFDTLRKMREEEREDGTEEIFARRDNLPFSGNEPEEKKEEKDKDNDEKKKNNIQDPKNEDGRPVTTNKDVFVKAVEQTILARADKIIEDIEKILKKANKVDKMELDNAIIYASILAEHDIGNAMKAVSEKPDYLRQDIDIERESRHWKSIFVEDIEEARNKLIVASRSIHSFSDDNEKFLLQFSEAVAEYRESLRKMIDRFHAFSLAVTIPEEK